jgi:hypothetical protein
MKSPIDFKLESLKRELKEIQKGTQRKVMDKEQLQKLRTDLIELRNDCLGPAVFDPNGSVILSHAIRWLYFKIEGKEYQPE